MLLSKQQLNFLIRQQINENIELDDVIEDFETEFEAAEEADDKHDAIIAIRKNNALLEIIFLLVDQNSKEFQKFYASSGFDIKDGFIDEQEKKRKQDLKKIKALIKKFLDALRNAKDADGFKTALNVLKNDLKDYPPTWYPLQYLFMSITNSDRFNKYLEEIAKNDSNWNDNQIEGLQILNSNVIEINAIIKKINDNKLTSEEKKELIGDKVRSKSFLKGIKKNEWSFVTDFIDDVAKFFFPRMEKSITSELESWFEELQKAFGKDPNEPWLEEMLMEDPDFKKLVLDAKNGNSIKKETLMKVTNNIEKKTSEVGEGAENKKIKF